ncbi:MAG: Holliday junction branch migration protein RuvA [Rickettsiales bacterium]|jgi:Holliday junction DNA helicase RuvA|nr:Holliday junction branch migration protein RuvA [Rickettsiales bacterium]
MIARLVGVVDSISMDSVVIMVGGVGYLVNASGRTLSGLQVGKEVSLIIETRVREDAFLLFGFIDSLERQWFLKLTGVQGVGNKLGLVILSYLSVNDLERGILAGDKDVFKAVPGVGPKLGVRIITELHGKVGNMDAPLIEIIDENQKGIAQEAVSALVNLGYKKNEAFEVVSRLVKQNEGVGLSDLITLALKSGTR